MERKPTPDELLDIIRTHCIDCCGGSRKDVRECNIRNCNLWKYRMGKTKYKSQNAVRMAKGSTPQLTLFDFLERA